MCLACIWKDRRGIPKACLAHATLAVIAGEAIIAVVPAEAGKLILAAGFGGLACDKNNEHARRQPDDHGYFQRGGAHR